MGGFVASLLLADTATSVQRFVSVFIGVYVLLVFAYILMSWIRVGYSPTLERVLEDVADSFESVWRERGSLAERVEVLELELARHVELETLLRSTLVSAERAAQDLKEQARREADLIVSEANGEARRVLRDAITEKERVLGDTRRVQSLLRSALAVIDELPDEQPSTDASPEPAAAETTIPGERSESQHGFQRLAG